jgi:hypothetical protein
MRKTISTLVMALGLAGIGAPAVADGASPSSAFAAYMKAEGGDTRPCVTSREFDVVHVGAGRREVRRVFDTPGHKVSKRAMQNAAAPFLDMLDLDAQDIETAPLRDRVVRRYVACDEPDTVILVEFNTRAHRWDQMVWN